MGDLKEAPAVHFNFPLLSFSLYITFKSGLPLPVSLFLRNRGGLVIEGPWISFTSSTELKSSFPLVLAIYIYGIHYLGLKFMKLMALFVQES